MRKNILKYSLCLAILSVALSGIMALDSLMTVTAQIENAVEINKTSIDFGVVSQGQTLQDTVEVALTDAFINQDRANTVEYQIIEKPRCKIWEGSECRQYFESLCPFLDELSAESEWDTKYSAFLNRINDIADTWNINLSGLMSEGSYKCELWIEVTGIEMAGTAQIPSFLLTNIAKAFEAHIVVVSAIVGEPPEPEPETLKEKAIWLANSVLGAPYLGDGVLWGGKGWNGARYVEENEIREGYHYYNAVSERPTKMEFGAGLDCSGLLLWSFNKANNACHYIYPEPGLCPECPIGYAKADKQYRKNTNPISKYDLTPGDLLFYTASGCPDNYPEPDGLCDTTITHAMLYTGNFNYSGGTYNVIHAMLDTEKISPAFYDVNNETLTTLWSGEILGDRPSEILLYRRLKEPDAEGVYWYIINSPATMIVIDPDGEVVDKNNSETVSMEYFSYNMDEDEEIEDVVMVTTRKQGEYNVQVVPNDDALPTDTFTLEIKSASSSIMLAENVLISDIPKIGYFIDVTDDEIIPKINMIIDVDPFNQRNSILYDNKKGYAIGLLFVALFSNNQINAQEDIDRASLTFGGTGKEQSLALCLPIKQDIDGDGKEDLVCLFEAKLTGLEPEDTKAVLRGKTKSGDLFIGSDNVQIISLPPF